MKHSYMVQVGIEHPFEIMAESVEAAAEVVSEHVSENFRRQLEFNGKYYYFMFHDTEVLVSIELNDDIYEGGGF